MKMKKFIIAVLVAVFMAAGCGGSSGNGSSGGVAVASAAITITFTTAGAEGDDVIVALFINGQGCYGESIAEAAGTLDALGVAAIALTGLANGTYDVCVLIDLDSDGQPSTGDYLSTAKEIVVNVTGAAAFTNANFPGPIPVDNVTITVNYAANDGKIAYAVLVPVGGDPDIGEIASGMGTLVGGTVDILLSPGVLDGSYHVYAFIDLDASGPDMGPDSGDAVTDEVDAAITVVGATGKTFDEVDFTVLP